MGRKSSLAVASRAVDNGDNGCYAPQDIFPTGKPAKKAKSQLRRNRATPSVESFTDEDDDNDSELEDAEEDDDYTQNGNSEESEDSENGLDSGSEKSSSSDSRDGENENTDDYASEESDGDGRDESEGPGTTAFGRAFHKIMKKKLPSTTLTETMGPMLSEHKKLIAKKLEEAASLQKSKTESKREKQAIREKGHMNVTFYPTSKDRELIKLATKGVVKLFNAVSKAQSVQESAKVSKDMEPKEVLKRSKSAFLATLQGGNAAHSGSRDSQEKIGTENQTGWSALQDGFMLGKSNLKDWDKKQDVEDKSGDIESDDSLSD